MAAREVLDRSATPDGEPLVLTLEPSGHYLLRVSGLPLMSSAAHASEEAMAGAAREVLGPREGARVLVGGLGMGFTSRAALDHFQHVTVAELLPDVVRYNRDIFGHLAEHPLGDPRLELFEGDVREPLARGGWDAILMDVDQGPDAVTTKGNQGLYGRRGARRLAGALTPGGCVVVWSAYESPGFERRLQDAGLEVEARRVRARGTKGARHVLFIGRR